MIAALALLTPTLQACATDVETNESDDAIVTKINTCGNAATIPTLYSSGVTKPTLLDEHSSTLPPGFSPTLSRIERHNPDNSPIEYASGSMFELSLDTDGCTYVSKAMMGSHELSATGPGGYYLSTTDTRNDAGRHGFNVDLTYPISNDGSTELITLTLQRIGGAGTRTYSVPLVHVKQIVPAKYMVLATPQRSDVEVGTSVSEIYNIFADKLFNTFGPYNRTRQCNDQGTDCHTLKNYDPSSLSVVANTSGISFSYTFDIEDTCTPTATVSGSFGVTANSNGVALDWHGPVDAAVNWHACDALFDLGPFSTIIYNAFFASASGKIATAVQNRITSEISLNPNVPWSLLDGTITRTNELVTKVEAPVYGVEFEVAYDPFVSTTRKPTYFSTSDLVAIFASGLGGNDISTIGHLPTFPGPLGLPGGVFPWPAETMSRNLAQLPDPGASVGQLLMHQATTTQSPYYRYAVECAPPGNVRFGVNDTASDATRITGFSYGYHVTALFGLPSTACAHATSGGTAGEIP